MAKADQYLVCVTKCVCTREYLVGDTKCVWTREFLVCFTKFLCTREYLVCDTKCVTCQRIFSVCHKILSWLIFCCIVNHFDHKTDKSSTEKIIMNLFGRIENEWIKVTYILS